MQSYELNLDGLVGPSHHYAGLSAGNLASISHAHIIANPAAAAHQGIAKMRLLHDLGLKQGVLPPHPRPNLPLLHQLGFYGTPKEQLKQAQYTAPDLLSACYSASSMWAANTATISPSIDTQDQRVHFTAANLVSNLHRHQEADFSSFLLRTIFSNPHYFKHHSPLPKTMVTADEGAANHNRLCHRHGEKGLHVFVYGKQVLPVNLQYPAPKHCPARQTFEASSAIARKHQLPPKQVVFAFQNPEVIDQGVFHNDVIAVANESVFFLHEKAFLNQTTLLNRLKQAVDFPLHIIEVSDARLSVNEVVASYLFNAQLVTLPDHSMAFIAPTECEQTPQIRDYIDEHLLASQDIPITQVHYLDLKQSMQNGGGPACLRLRVPLTEQELSSMHQGILVSHDLLDTLEDWINQHYRTSLHTDDLADPELMDECFTALDALTKLLNLGSIYPFQQA